MTEKPAKDSRQTPPPEPVDMSDGIPDRGARMSWAVIGSLIAVFVAWCIFLVYCQYGGRI